MATATKEEIAKVILDELNAQGDDLSRYVNDEYGIDGVVLDGSFDLVKVAEAVMKRLRLTA